MRCARRPRYRVSVRRPAVTYERKSAADTVRIIARAFLIRAARAMSVDKDAYCVSQQRRQQAGRLARR